MCSLCGLPRLHSACCDVRLMYYSCAAREVREARKKRGKKKKAAAVIDGVVVVVKKRNVSALSFLIPFASAWSCVLIRCGGTAAYSLSVGRARQGVDKQGREKRHTEREEVASRPTDLVTCLPSLSPLLFLLRAHTLLCVG